MEGGCRLKPTRKPQRYQADPVTAQLLCAPCARLKTPLVCGTICSFSPVFWPRGHNTTGPRAQCEKTLRGFAGKRVHTGIASLRWANEMDLKCA